MTCPSWPPPSGHAPLSSATSLGESAAPAGGAARPPAALADLLTPPAVVAVRLAVAALGGTARVFWAGAVRRVATAAHSMPPHEGNPAHSVDARPPQFSASVQRPHTDGGSSAGPRRQNAA